MCDSRIISIDSRDRVSGTLDNFSVLLPEAVTGTRFRLIDCSIPMTMYTIENGRNTFTLKEGVDMVNIVLTNGMYTGTSLAAELASQLTNNSPNNLVYTVTYNTSQFVFTVNAGTFGFVFFEKNMLADKLGFERGVTINSQGTVLTSTQCPHINPPDYLFIIINELPTNGISSGNEGLFTFKVSSVALTYQVIEHKLGDYPLKYDNHSNSFTLTRLNVSVHAYGNEKVTLRSDFNLTLEIS